MSGNDRKYGRQFRLWALAALGALGLGLVHIMLPSGAVAASGVQRVTGSTSSTVNSKTLTVRCPQGRTATGGFASISGVSAGVHIDRIWPNGDTVEIHAKRLPSVTTAWRISGGAICTTKTPDIQYVQSASATLSRASDHDRRFGKLVFVDCPNGKELIGLGGTAVGARLHQLQPNGPSVPYTGELPSARPVHGVTVLASAYTEGSSDPTIRAMAVCANPGHGTKVQFAETLSTTSPKTTTITCPAGKQLHAIGALMFYPNHYADNTPFSFAMYNAFTQNTNLVTGSVRAERHVDNIPNEEWDLVNYGLCSTT